MMSMEYSTRQMNSEIPITKLQNAVTLWLLQKCCKMESRMFLHSPKCSTVSKHEYADTIPKNSDTKGMAMQPDSKPSKGSTSAEPPTIPLIIPTVAMNSPFVNIPIWLIFKMQATPIQIGKLNQDGPLICLKPNFLGKLFQKIKTSIFLKYRRIIFNMQAQVSSDTRTHQSSSPHESRNSVLRKMNDWVTGKEAQANKLKEVQEISCLYSEHIYKSFKKDHFYQAQLDKYKTMYEKEKKQKVKLLMEQRVWQEQKQRVLAQKQVILFALDSLTLRVAEQQQKSFENPDSLPKRNSSKIRNRCSKILEERDENIVAGKISKPTRFSKNSYNLTQSRKSGFKNDSLRQSFSSLSGKGASFNQEKLKLLKKLRDKLNIKNTEMIEGIFDNSEEQEKNAIEMSEGYAKMSEKVEVQELRIMELEREVKQLQINLGRKNNELQTNETNRHQLSETVTKISLEKTETMQELEEMGKKYREEVNKNKQLTAAKELLEDQLRLTQEQYSRKEEKERHCVKILQKFSMELRLNDQKIQQFISNQFGNYDQEEKGLQRTKKTYHEHLSYILHLCKKKETLYENLIDEFKQKIKESDFRIIVLEKKIRLFGDFHNELRKSFENCDKMEKIADLVYRFKK